MARPAAQPTEVPSSKLERLLVILAALGAWSIVPPYLGPLVGLELDVRASVEFVDHVIPGLVVVLAALVARSFARRGETDSMPVLAALGSCVLAGLLQTVSHLPLVLDAGGPLQPVAAVILHATPGPAVLGLALWLLLRPAPEDAAA